MPTRTSKQLASTIFTSIPRGTVVTKKELNHNTNEFVQRGSFLLASDGHHRGSRVALELSMIDPGASNRRTEDPGNNEGAAGWESWLVLAREMKTKASCSRQRGDGY